MNKGNDLTNQEENQNLTPESVGIAENKDMSRDNADNIKTTNEMGYTNRCTVLQDHHDSNQDREKDQGAVRGSGRPKTSTTLACCLTIWRIGRC